MVLYIVFIRLCDKIHAFITIDAHGHRARLTPLKSHNSVYGIVVTVDVVNEDVRYFYLTYLY